MHHPARKRALLDVLTCIREGCTIDQRRLPPRRQRRAPPQGAGRGWRACSAPTRTRSPAPSRSPRCRFSLDELRYEYPDRGHRRRRETRRQALAAPDLGRRRGERYPGGVPAGVKAPSPRAGVDRRARLRALLSSPSSTTSSASPASARHPLPGPRLGGQLGGLLLPRHHRRRSRRASTCCSSASSAPSATSRPTSTSTSSTSAARR